MKKTISFLLVAAVFVSTFAMASAEYSNAYITNYNIDSLFKQNIELEFLNSLYRGYMDSIGKVATVFFCRAEGDLSNVTEAGFEIEGKYYKVSDKHFSSFATNGKYGIAITDENNLLPDLYNVKPYVIAGGELIEGSGRIVEKPFIESAYVKWSDYENIYDLQGTNWRFYPEDNYISKQNPPDFSWPFIENAKYYDLVISKTPTFDEIYASKSLLPVNYYNFSYAFDKDIYYYKVRFHTGNEISEWSDVRRFSISSDAVEFPVDDIDVMLSKIPSEHPRIAFNPQKEEAMRDIAQRNGFVAEKKALVEEYIKSGKVQEEPKTDEEFYDAGNVIDGQLFNSAVVYYYGNDKEAGAYAKKALLSVCDWNIYGTSSYVAHDTKFRDVVANMAFTYSYINDLLSEEEKAKVLSGIKERALILEHPTEGIMDSVFMIKNSPYMSHGGSALKALLEIALCTYRDLPEAERWLREYLPLYINYYPNWGKEDGGWSQGTGYGQLNLTDEKLNFTLYLNGMIDMYRKPYYKNYYNYLIYNVGAGNNLGAEFGDQSDGKANSSWALAASNLARATGNGYAAFFHKNSQYGRIGGFSRFFMDYFSYPQIKDISVLPHSHYFSDIGWVSMLSETSLEDRIATYFKSSPYGSHNHSHADQNTFTISKGENQLAIDSGYYDGYGSGYYSNYYKSTYAHNGITYNNGKGQTTYAMCANGDITGYIGSDEFDLAAGDAKNAYNFVYNPQTQGYIEKPNFDKMKRYFLYIRPDMYVVIDDIAFGNNTKEGTLEWWINGWNFSSYSGNEAVIDNGTDALDVKMHYPKNITLNYYEGFVKPDGNSIIPSGKYASMAQSNRINFRTGTVKNAKFVATMQIRGSGEEKTEVKIEEGNGYIKLTFKDGTVVYINLTDSEINVDSIKTDAVAVAVKNNACLMAEGSYLIINNESVVSAKDKISVYTKDGEISIFSDCNTEVEVKGITGTTFTNEYGKNISGNIRDGLMYTPLKDGMLFEIVKGSYKLKY